MPTFLELVLQMFTYNKNIRGRWKKKLIKRKVNLAHVLKKVLTYNVQGGND